MTTGPRQFLKANRNLFLYLGLKVDQCLDFLVGGSTNVVPQSNMDISHYIPNNSGKREFK